ncbi:MaoC family dehydratase [soil metagenome]
MSLEALIGRTYGPVSARITADRVAKFVDVTGDDPERWRAAAPPGYAAALLFAVAPSFIQSPEVGENTRVLVHTDQRFVWHRPLTIDSAVVVEAVVGKVRSRGGISFVGFEVVTSSDGEPLVSSWSTFLMGSRPATEPGPDQREPEVTAGSIPADRGTVTERGASRLDLVRYAAASGDFNPIHFDHQAARAAGLDGIVVHGLLMASWLIQAAAAGGMRTDPIADLKVRFRAPLAPGEVARIEAVPGPTTADGITPVTLALRRGQTDLVTATAQVRGESAT